MARRRIAKATLPRHTMSGHLFSLHAVVAALIMVLIAHVGCANLDGTLLFLHVWKCGGTSLRQLVCDWAGREGLSCATVAGCSSLSLEQRKICLVNHKLIFPDIQGKFIANQRVLAGHFQWGFQAYAAEPHFLVTMLRNPLELFVSGEQYLNRKATSTLPSASRLITHSMRTSLAHTNQPPGFLHRFVGRSVITRSDVREATVEGAHNMESFSLVGVVEQYTGFISVMQAILDPLEHHSQMWEAHLNRKLNESPVSSSRVLAEMDPALVAHFNSTLSYQWLVYGHAVRLYTAKCEEILAKSSHSRLCHVQSAPNAYR